MPNERHLEILRQGYEAWGKWRKDNPDIDPDLSDITIDDEIDFDCMDFSRVNFSGSTVYGDLNSSVLDGADLSRSDFSRQCLWGASLVGANLTGANFSCADLRRAKLRDVIVEGADLRGIDVDGGTEISSIRLEESIHGEACLIDSYTLKILGKKGPSLSEQSLLYVNDDLLFLKELYSGFRLWIHLFALAVFLFPYAWFVGVHYSEARFYETPPSNGITLFEALLRYIWNGGENWRSGWYFSWSFLAFAFLAAYNLLRGLILWKTLRLEQKEIMKGGPVKFSRFKDPFWRFLINLMNSLFIFGMALLAYNTYHFLSQQIITH